MNEDLEKFKTLKLESAAYLEEIPPNDLELELAEKFNVPVKQFKNLLNTSNTFNDFLNKIKNL